MVMEANKMSEYIDGTSAIGQVSTGQLMRSVTEIRGGAAQLRLNFRE
jgi:hypothetical protein